MGEMHKDRSQLLGSLKCERKIKGRIRLVDCRMGVFTVSWKPEVWKRGEKGNRLVDEFCSHGCRVSGASLLQETCSNIRISAHEIPLNHGPFSRHEHSLDIGRKKTNSGNAFRIFVLVPGLCWFGIPEAIIVIGVIAQ